MNRVSEIDINVYRYWSFAIEMINLGKINYIRAIEDSHKWVDYETNKNKILPWITFGAIELLENIITSNEGGLDVFEYGSGNSTIFLASRVKNIVSIEHDKSYYDELYRRINNLPLNADEKINLRLIEAQEVDFLDGYVSSNDLFQKKSFKNYVTSINNYQDFDIVIIDGRSRVACCKEAWKKVKKDGWLILDDSEREEYKEGISFIIDQHAEVHEYFGACPGVAYMKQTTFFRKVI